MFDFKALIGLRGYTYAIERTDDEYQINFFLPEESSINYYLSYNKNSAPYKLEYTIPGVSLDFNISSNGELVATEETKALVAKAVLTRIQQQSTFLFREMLRAPTKTIRKLFRFANESNMEQLSNVFSEIFSSGSVDDLRPLRLHTERRVKEETKAPTQAEIDKAEQIRKELEAERPKPKPAGKGSRTTGTAVQHPETKELNKKIKGLLSALDEDITYLQGLVQRNQNPKPAKLNLINQHLKELSIIEKKSGFASYPNIAEILAKKQSLELLLNKNINKSIDQAPQITVSMEPVECPKKPIHTQKKAQDNEFNRFAMSYTIHRGSNTVGHPLYTPKKNAKETDVIGYAIGKWYDLPKKYQFKPEFFREDHLENKNVISSNDVAKRVRPTFFGQRQSPRSSTDQAVESTSSLVNGECH